jgi:histidinol-phosphate aminotransferase
MEDKLFTRIVTDLPPAVPFVPPEALERQMGRSLVLRLGANESNFGASPLARAAMLCAVEELHCYSDPEGFELRQELARRHEVEMGEVGLGSGIDEILGLMVRLFVEPGDAVLTSAGAYPTFNYHAVGHGAVLHAVPYRDDREDLSALLHAAEQIRPKIVYVANPDNPMGSWNAAAEVMDFAHALPPDCILLLDEAYADFAAQGIIPPVDTRARRVVRLRTFSKAHGMAGARIGYMLAHREVVGALDKVRNHFGVNRVAQAGALASLRDGEFVRSVVEQVEQGKSEYAALAQELGGKALPSATNFVAFDIGSGARARALVTALLKRGIFVRMPGVEPLDRCIRVTVGTAAERSAFAAGLRLAWAELGS